MARRRALSQDIVLDEEFNALSLEGQNLFIRMLAVSDDCGVVPATPFTLAALTAVSEAMRSRIMEILAEIAGQKLGTIIAWRGKPFFLFKQEAFARYQSYIFNKRTQSEYLRMTAAEFDAIDWAAAAENLGTVSVSNENAAIGKEIIVSSISSFPKQQSVFNCEAIDHQCKIKDIRSKIEDTDRRIPPIVPPSPPEVGASLETVRVASTLEEAPELPGAARERAEIPEPPIPRMPEPRELESIRELRPINPPKRRGKTRSSPEAEAVYAEYPRKEARAAALPVIAAAIATHGYEHVLQATRRYAEAVARWPEEQRRYVPHPATWFRQERYNDDPALWERTTVSVAGHAQSGYPASVTRSGFVGGYRSQPDAYGLIPYDDLKRRIMTEDRNLMQRYTWEWYRSSANVVLVRAEDPNAMMVPESYAKRIYPNA